MGKLDCNTRLPPLINITMVETTIMLLWNALVLNVGSLQREPSHHQRRLLSISQIDMTNNTLLIDRSARKIHESTTVNITLIWKMYPPHEPKSRLKYKDTLEKRSPLTPLQIQTPPENLLRWKSKPNRLSRLEISKFMVKATSTVLESYILQQKKEEKKVRRIWQPLCCHGSKKLSVILLRAPRQYKMQGIPSKERKHQECRCYKK